jgi:hypothetical protein
VRFKKQRLQTYFIQTLVVKDLSHSIHLFATDFSYTGRIVGYWQTEQQLRNNLVSLIPTTEIVSLTISAITERPRIIRINWRNET